MCKITLYFKNGLKVPIECEEMSITTEGNKVVAHEFINPTTKIPMYIDWNEVYLITSEKLKEA